MQEQVSPYALRTLRLGTAWSSLDKSLADCVGAHENLSNDLRAKHSEIVELDSTSFSNELALSDWLKKGKVPFDLFYFYGHSHADSSLYGSKLLLDPESQGIRISELTSDMTSNVTGNTVESFKTSRPILFLNSCSGAQLGALQESFFHPRVNSIFLDFLSRRGFIGLLAPEQNVEKRFASRFALEFFERWLHSGQPLDTVLLHLRRQALEDPLGNPFVLVYSYYGNGNVWLDGQVKDSERLAPHWHHVVTDACLESLGQERKK